MRPFVLLLLSCWTLCAAQSNDEIRPWNAVGLRFATHANWHPRPNERFLVDGTYTTGVLGVYYKRFGPTTGFDVGLNINYKDNDGRGFPNLPAIMNDYSEDGTQNVGLTALELDFKAGPRFGLIQPKIGYVIGYRLQRSGYFTDLAPADWEINRLYLLLPMGVAADLPIRWGSVGAGAFFNVGVLNVVREPASNQGSWDGGRLRAFTFEITVSYGNR